MIFRLEDTTDYNRALKCASDYSSPGTIGHVLAELATTGSCDLGELLRDVRQTIRYDHDALADLAWLAEEMSRAYRHYLTGEEVEA